MSKHRRSPSRRRLPLVLELLESRESPTSLLGLAGTSVLGAAAFSVIQRSSGAGGKAFTWYPLEQDHGTMGAHRTSYGIGASVSHRGTHHTAAPGSPPPSAELPGSKPLIGSVLSM